MINFSLFRLFHFRLAAFGRFSSERVNTAQSNLKVVRKKEVINK